MSSPCRQWVCNRLTNTNLQTSGACVGDLWLQLQGNWKAEGLVTVTRTRAARLKVWVNPTSPDRQIARVAAIETAMHSKIYRIISKALLAVQYSEPSEG